MGPLRILLQNNHGISSALLVALLVWIGGVPTLSTAGCLTSGLKESKADSTSDADTSDQEDDRPVLGSLEALVAPVAKLHMALPVGFAPPRVVHETVAPIRIALSVPQNNYLRTLFRLINPANAP